jgi:hypothetical protein
LQRSQAQFNNHDAYFFVSVHLSLNGSHVHKRDLLILPECAGVADLAMLVQRDIL